MITQVATDRADINNISALKNCLSCVHSEVVRDVSGATKRICKIKLGEWIVFFKFHECYKSKEVA